MNKRGLVYAGVVGLIVIFIVLSIAVIFLLHTTTAIELQTSYSLGDRVKLDFGDIGRYKLTLIGPTTSSSQDSSDPVLLFKPSEVGKYKVIVEYGNRKDQYFFEVHSPNTTVVTENEIKIPNQIFNASSEEITPLDPNPPISQQEPVLNQDQNSFQSNSTSPSFISLSRDSTQGLVEVNTPLQSTLKESISPGTKKVQVRLPSHAQNVTAYRIDPSEKIQLPIIGDGMLKTLFSNLFTGGSKTYTLENVEGEIEITYSSPGAIKSTSKINSSALQIDILPSNETLSHDVLAYQEITNLTDGDSLQITSSNNESIDFFSIDSTGDSQIDRVEWIIPSIQKVMTYTLTTQPLRGNPYVDFNFGNGSSYVYGEKIRFNLRSYPQYDLKIYSPGKTYSRIGGHDYFFYQPSQYGLYRVVISQGGAKQEVSFRVDRGNFTTPDFHQGNARVHSPVSWFGVFNNQSFVIPAGNNLSIKGANGEKINYTTKSYQGYLDIQLNGTSPGEVIVQYQTDPPLIEEKYISQQEKEILISSPPGVDYTQVYSESTIPDILRDASQILLYWKNENQTLPFEVYDDNSNGNIDRISWITPHLSNQTFSIILIVQAEHLDSQRNFIEEVYEKVKDRDGVYQEIPQGDYLRVTFEKPLTSQNDITVYAYSTASGADIEVYSKNGSTSLASFGGITNDSKYQILLNELPGNETTFDLLSKWGPIFYDFVIDPFIDNGTAVQNVSSCGILNTTGASYYLQNNLISNGTCITVNASHLLVDCQGFYINYSLQGITGHGLFTNATKNITVRNCKFYDGNSSSAANWLKHAIYYYNSSDGLIENNNITTNGNTSYGIFMEFKSNGTLIKNNSVFVNGFNSRSIVLSQFSGNSQITNNSLLASGIAGYGIYLFSDVNSTLISNNTINTSNTNGHGILLQTRCLFNTVSSNSVRTGGNTGYAIYILTNSNSNLVHNNTVTTLNSNGIGISPGGTSLYNIIRGNRINTTGASSYGLYLTANYNNASENMVFTSGANSYGVLFQNDYNNLFWNTILTSGSLAHGVYFNSARYANLTGNSVRVNQALPYYLVGTTRDHYNHNISVDNLAQGLPINFTYNVQGRNYNNINFSTFGQVIFAYTQGIAISNSSIGDGGLSLFYTNYTSLRNVTISTLSTPGITMLQTVHFTNISDSTITTRATNGYGLLLSTNIRNTQISAVNIATTNSSAHGIYMTSQIHFTNITNTHIQINGSNTYGIHMNTNVNFSKIEDTSINLLGATDYAIYLVTNIYSNYFENLTLNVSSSNGIGTYLYSNVIGNVFNKTRISVSGASAIGVYIRSPSFNTFDTFNVQTNSTNAYSLYVYDAGNQLKMRNGILNSSSAGVNDIFFNQWGNADYLNLTNVSYGDLFWRAGYNGTLNEHWFLNVYARYTNGTPASGVNLTLYDNDTTLIFSNVTDSDGRIEQKEILALQRNQSLLNFSTPHFLNATLDTQDRSRMVNLSLNQFITLIFFTEADKSPPQILINYPLNGSTIEDTTPVLNITLNSTAQTVLYSLSNGNINWTFCESCINESTTNLHLAEGTYTAVLYANGTTSDTSTNRTTFTIFMNGNYSDQFFDNSSIQSFSSQTLLNYSRGNITFFGNPTYYHANESKNTSVIYTMNANGYPLNQLFIGPFPGSNLTAFATANGTDIIPTTHCNGINITTSNPSNNTYCSNLGTSWIQLYSASGNFNWATLFAGGDTTNVFGLSTIYVYSPSNRSVKIRMGKDDSVQLFINDNYSYFNITPTGVAADQFETNASFNAGWNKVTFKVTQGGGGWGLNYRFTDLLNVGIPFNYSLNLPDGILLGNFTALSINTTSTIKRLLNITWDESGTTINNTLVVQVSLNNGGTWQNATNGEPLVDVVPGNKLIYRVLFSANTPSNITFSNINMTWSGNTKTPPTIILSAPSGIVKDVTPTLNVSINDSASALWWTMNNGKTNTTFCKTYCPAGNYTTHLYVPEGVSRTVKVYANNSQSETSNASISFSADMGFSMFDDFEDNSSFGTLNTVYWGRGNLSYTGTSTAQLVSDVQRGSATIPSGGSSINVTLSLPVDLNTSFLVFNYRVNDPDPGDSNLYGNLTNSTNIVFSSSTSQGNNNPIYIQWYVASFANGVGVQRGSITQGLTNNIVITPINMTSSFYLLSNQRAGATFGAADFIRGRLLNKTLFETTAVANPADITAWQVINYDGAYVQNGSFTMNTLSTSVSLPRPVNTNKAFVLATWSVSGNMQPDDAGLFVNLADSSNIYFERKSNTGTLNVNWQVVEFSNGESVRTGIAHFNLGESSVNVPINEVDPDKSIAFLSGNQKGGMSTYGANDVFGVVWATAVLTNSTTLKLERESTLAAADLQYYVIEFGSTTQDTATALSINTSSTVVEITNITWTTSGETNGNAIEIEVSADDGGTWESATNGIGLVDIIPGNNLLYRSTFFANGTSSVSLLDMTINWTNLTTPPPTITLNSPNGTISDYTPLVNVSLSGLAYTLWYTINSGKTNVTICTSCSGEQTAPLYVAERNYTLTVYATNRIGDESEVSAPFLVDMYFTFNDTFEDNSSLASLTNSQWVPGAIEYSSPSSATISRVMHDSTTIPPTTSSINVSLPSEVDLSKVFLVFSYTANNANPGDYLVLGNITNSTNILFATSTAQGFATIPIEWYVVEFISGANVQRGSLSQSSTARTSTLQAVNLSRTFSLISYFDDGNVFGTTDSIRGRFLTSTSFETYSTAVSTGQVAWQTIDYTGAQVQSGSFDLTTQTDEVSLDSPVDLSKSFVLATWSVSGNLQADDVGLVINITDPTTLYFERSSASGTINVHWQVVSFSGGEDVQKGITSFTTTALEKNITLNPINLNTSIAFLSGNQKGGSSPYAATYNMGPIYFTANLTNSTNLRLRRAFAGGQTANVEWYVVDFKPTTDANYSVRVLNTSSPISEISNISWTSTGVNENNTLAVQISANNGTNWFNATNGMGISAIQTGSNLIYRVFFNSVTPGNTISLQDMNISWTNQTAPPPPISIELPPNSTFADVTPTLNVTINSQAKRLWWTTTNGRVNTTLCTYCTGTFSTYLYLAEGNFTVKVYSSNNLDQITSNQTSFVIDMNRNYIDSFEDNSSMLIVNNISAGGGNVSFTGKDSEPSVTFYGYTNVPQVNGSWNGTYGKDGALLFGFGGNSNTVWTTFKQNNDVKNNSYNATSPIINYTVPNGFVYTWVAASVEARALRNTTNSNRRVSTLYSNPNPLIRLQINLSISSYNLSLYFLDYDTTARRQDVTVSDLSRRYNATHVMNYPFNTGRWITFQVRGIDSIDINVTRTAGNNAVLAGVFIDAFNDTASGNFTAYSINTTQSVKRISNITWNEEGTDDKNLLFVDISADNGVHWYRAQNNNNLSSIVTGNKLFYRVFFTALGNRTVSLTDMNISWQAPPTVTILYPGTYIYNSSVSGINVSIQSYTPLSTCWYSLNSTHNQTFSCTQNITGLTSVEGNSTWTVFANDSDGALGQSSVTFLVDMSAPNITFINQTDQDDLIVNDSHPLEAGQNLTIQVNATDLNLDSVWIVVWESIKGGTSKLRKAFTYVGGSLYVVVVETTNSWNTFYNYTIYANDTGRITAQLDGNFSIIKLNNTIFISPNPANGTGNITVSGVFYYSNGSPLGDYPFNLWLNQSLLSYENISLEDSGYNNFRNFTDTSSIDFDEGVYYQTSVANGNLTLASGNSTGNYTHLLDAGARVQWKNMVWSYLGASCSASVTYQTGDDHNYQGTVDTYISSATPLANFEGGQSLSLVKSSSTERILLNFDRVLGFGENKIPYNSTISQANITLSVYDAGDSISIYEILENWTVSQVSYSNRMTSTTWSSAGIAASPSRSNTLESSFTPFPASGFYTNNITNAFTRWASQTSPNYGVVLSPSAGNGVLIRSSEYATQNERPTLGVTFNASDCTSATITYRTSNDKVTWSTWRTISSGAFINDSNRASRYLEYKIEMTAFNSSYSPHIGEVRVNYTALVTNSTGGYSYLFASPFGFGDLSVCTNSSYRTIFTGACTPLTVLSSVSPTVSLISPAQNSWLSYGNVSFIYNASDRNGDITNTTLFINGLFNQTNTSEVFNGLYSSFALNLTSGYYNWSINVTDFDGHTVNSTRRTFSIDLNNPEIQLVSPTPDEQLSSNIVNLSYIATDTMDTSLTCSIVLDSSTIYSNVASANGSQINRSTGVLPGGVHFWNVTCLDNALRQNVSETWNFTIGDLPPTVLLVSPFANDISPDGNISFVFNASDDVGFANCSLFINDSFVSLNQSSINLGLNTSITVNSLAEGIYNFSVACTDDAIPGHTTNSGNRSFKVDLNPPKIYLNKPDSGLVLNTSRVSFNFTANDSIDSSLVCNLSINSDVPYAGISVTSGQLVNRIVENMSDAVHFWNVSCYDRSLHLNFSETRMLNVSEPPRVTLNIANATPYNTSTFTLQYTPTDNGNLSSCELYLNDQYAQGNSSALTKDFINPFDLVSILDGTYTWYVSCNDSVMLTARSPTYTFFVDSQPPNITLLYPLEEEVYARNISFNFSAEDLVSTSFVCNLSVDNLVQPQGLNFIVQNGTNTSKLISNISDGIHTWFVNCTDSAGNKGNSISSSFTKYSNPEVTLISPLTGTWLTTSAFNLSYYPEGARPIANASLFINGLLFTLNTSEISTNQENNFSLTGFGDGAYNWTVNVTDTLSLVGNTSTWVFYVDTHAPNFTLFTPSGLSTITTNNVSFNFSVYDNLDSSLTCNITNDGSPLYTGEVARDTPTTRYSLIPDGNHLWNVTCFDDAGNLNTSQTIQFTVLAPPNVTLQSPTPYQWISSRNHSFVFTPLDPIAISSCRIYLDGVINQTLLSGSLTPNVPNSVNITGMAEGIHNWTVNCTDPDSNTYTAPLQYFFVDVTPPTISLLNPANATNQLRRVWFNFSVTDNLAYQLSCNISLDGILNITNLHAMNSSISPFNISGIPLGNHNWNLSCMDNSSNQAFSQTWIFNVTLPELAINYTDIVFNDSSPRENETILINATIHNFANVSITNITVRFYENDPDVGPAYQIGQNITLTYLAGLNQTSVGVSWNAKVGQTNITVIVDPPFGSGGFIEEWDETNNKANTTIVVGSWQIVYGDVQTESQFALSDMSNSSVIRWNSTNYQDGNLYAADSDSSILWSRLKAIGSNSTGGQSANDFADIDTLLNMSGYGDSISSVFTTAGVIKETRNYTIFTGYVIDVPVANSTNSSDFLTGILWDSSDDSNGKFSISNREDLVFFTQINRDLPGKYGVYDYEIRIPAKLRSYKGPDSRSVSFYTELR